MPTEDEERSNQETNISDLIPSIVAADSGDESKQNPAWLADNDYNLFENVSDNKWIESLGGEPTFQFDQVEINNQENSVLLFDPKREVIVQLNEHDSNYGPNKEELRPLYNGRWLHPLNDNSQNDYLHQIGNDSLRDQAIEESSPDNATPNIQENNQETSVLKWAADNKINLFEHVSNTDDWIEKINDIETYHFKAVRFDKTNGLLLFDPSRHVFVEINSNNSNYGSTLENLRPLYHGKWLNLDYNDQLENLKNDHNYSLNSKDLSSLKGFFLYSLFKFIIIIIIKIKL